MTVPQAAAAMGVTCAQVRNWLHEGAPVARAGQRGRGHAALVDVAELTTWLRARERVPSEESHRQLAADLVADVAAVLIAGWRARTDPAKLRDAGRVVSEFAILAASVHARLGLPELTPADWPADIQQIVAGLQNFRQLR
jgi:phage terminase Nu1 subunit (DNA packaging protein)